MSTATSQSTSASVTKSSRVTFQLNGRGYETDAETLEVLRGIVPAARDSGDASAVFTVLGLGKASGRITELPL